MQSHAFLVLAAELSLRALALAGMAALLAALFRTRPAVTHAVWTTVLISMLVLPFLHRTVPAAHVRVSVIAPFAPPRSTPEIRPSVPAVPPRSTSAATPFPWLFAVYVSGVAILALRLFAGVFLTLRLKGSAHPAGSLLESDRVRVPVALGFFRPAVILPLEWRNWRMEKLDLILAHERSHASRRDPLIALLAAINKCMFWFHPLAWWLERHLAALAETIADEAALAVAPSSEAYAEVLLETASLVGRTPGRLILHGAAMNGPSIARRIHRVLSSPAGTVPPRIGAAARATLSIVGILLLWAAAVIDFQSIARAQIVHLRGPDDDGAHLGYLATGGPRSFLTADEAAAYARQLEANPEDESAREQLLAYDWTHKLKDQRIPLVLWLIQHHPDSVLHGDEIASIDAHDPTAYEDAKNLWLAAVNQFPDNPRVLSNAARAIGDSDMARCIDLMKRAQQIDPAHRTRALADVDSLILVNEAAKRPGRWSSPELAARIKNDLLQSNDIALVGSVARSLVEAGAGHALTHPGDLDFVALKATALTLTNRAQSIDPQNRDWADLVEGIRELPGNQP